MEFQDNAASWWQKVVEKFPEHPTVLARGSADLGNDATDPCPALPVTH
jgi:hypothetical protein